MPSKPIPGSTGEVLTCLAIPLCCRTRRPASLYLPRFIAKCKYVKEHGAPPASYAKNYKRGLDRFLCLHLGVDPGAVEKIVHEAGDDAADSERRLREVFRPTFGRPNGTSRTGYRKERMTEAGGEFPRTGAHGHGLRRSHRRKKIKSVPDLIDFDEGRID